MIKYIELPDFHFDIAWLDVSKMCSESVRQAIVKHNIDFIAMPGDFFNRPLYATDSGGLNEARKIIKSWLELVPVCAIEGTPSHDGTGCYGSLEDAGLVLLNPNKVYFFKNKKISEMSIEKTHLNVDAILFGIPELNKKNIQSKLNLNSEKANLEVIKQLDNYINCFIAPLSLMYQSYPKIGLFHGVVSDNRQENSLDNVIKYSDIIIHTETLHQAGLDRWSLGHIHTPWESEKICAGYAGSWSINWGECGFNPCFHVVSIDENNKVEIEHEPYGTPKREKITEPLDYYSKKTAYQLRTGDENAKKPDGHEWSELIIESKKQITRRGDNVENKDELTLCDLFKIANPEVSKSVIEKVKELEKQKQSAIKIDKKIILKSITVKGCSLFKEKTIKFSLPENGLYELAGDNGSGKSSLLGFCSPYPVVIGKETKSGRSSAIKDFFTGQESLIEKVFDVNGVEHKHLITIKGAHTQNPKVECYLNINSSNPTLDLSTFETMMSKCEELYGPYNDYLLTTFYVQPLQGKEKTGLMSATSTDIRDLVQSLAGIDREAEKRIALNRQNSIEKEIDNINFWLSGVKEFKDVDKSTIENEIVELIKTVDNFEIIVSTIEKEIAKQRKIVEELTKTNAVTELERKRKLENDFKKTNIIKEIEETKKVIEKTKDYKSIDVLELQKKLDDDRVLREEKIKYEQKALETASCISGKMLLKSKMKNEVESARKRITDILLSIEMINKPCANCGYISSEAKGKIDEYNDQIIGLEKSIVDLTGKIDNIVIPEQKEKPTYFLLMPEKERIAIKEKIAAAQNVQTIINTNTEIIMKLSAQLNEIESQVYDIKDVGELLYKENDVLSMLNEELFDKKEILTKNKSELLYKKSSLDKIKSIEKEIEKKEKENKTLSCDLEDWKYIAVMLQAAKIPAIELDMVINEIDDEATKIIEHFEDGRYSFVTETQTEGKKNIVDRFDVKIHDSITGQYQSFVSYNPGHKAFFNDAYTKALVKQRNKRSHRQYSPVILDEADSPIQPESILKFYEMQLAYWRDAVILIVSHSPASRECINNKIEIGSLT